MLILEHELNHDEPVGYSFAEVILECGALVNRVASVSWC
jgi:hypothetical protein